eukprot:scaffold62557_cov69-Phaeocystis_antarctica.AAC.3
MVRPLSPAPLFPGFGPPLSPWSACARHEHASRHRPSRRASRSPARMSPVAGHVSWGQHLPAVLETRHTLSLYVHGFLYNIST